MIDYEVKGSGMHAFVDATEYEDLLVAIDSWWRQITLPSKVIEAISFNVVEDGSINALVHWAYLPEESAEKLKQIVAEEKTRPLDLPLSEVAKSVTN